MSNEETKSCPACAEEIKAIAQKCKHCGEILDDSLKQASTEILQSSLAPETKAKIQNDLDGLTMHTGKLFGLTVATGGWLYLLLHLSSIKDRFNLVFGNSMGTKLVAAMTFTYGVFLLLFTNLFTVLSSLVADRAAKSAIRDVVNLMSGTQILGTAAVIMLIIISFKARKGIEIYAKEIHGVEFKMSPVATLFFNFFYINYSLNKLKNM